MNETFSEKDLVDFGNYLLSDERKKSVKRINHKNVTDADLQNFKTRSI